MNEVIAACIGAVVSIFLFTLSIIVNRKDKDVRALFKRVALLEQKIAAARQQHFFPPIANLQPQHPGLHS